MRRPYPTDHSEVDEPVRLAGAGPRHRCPPRSFHPLEGGSDPPCWRPPFTSRSSVSVAPRSIRKRKAGCSYSIRSMGFICPSAHIYAATRHIVGEAQSRTSPRALTRHPTGRGYAGCCIPTSEIVLPRSWVNRALRDPPYTLTGVRRSCSPRVETRHRWGPHRTGSGGRRGRPAPRWGIYVACFRSAVAYPYCGRPTVR
jgi:hypothetical protein